MLNLISRNFSVNLLRIYSIINNKNMKSFDQPEIIAAHKESSYHRHILRGSDLCGCFYCLDTFDYQNIETWCDDGNTAICPSCGIDSVIGAASGYPITEEFLTAMKKHWFC